jgi:hypothetical protein
LKGKEDEEGEKIKLGGEGDKKIVINLIYKVQTQ